MFNPHQAICITKGKWLCPCIHIDTCAQFYTTIDLNRFILKRMSRWAPTIKPKIKKKLQLSCLYGTFRKE